MARATRSKRRTSKTYAVESDCAPMLSVIDNGTPADILLLSKPQLLEFLGVSYSSVFNWMRAGLFPLPRVIGPSSGRSSRIAWYASEVQAWLASRPQRQIKSPSQ
jgi:predicted DNA-binding transcriptional regulator AlpA